MPTVITFKCESCGMEFFNSSNILKDLIKKDLTCPYCGSELWHTLISK